MSTIKELTPEQFRKMQLVQTEMLVEFDRVCRENDIRYVLTGGSMLGAVRHNGYIPWDDDADIAMLREDYEKFKRIAYKLNHDICFFQDYTTDPFYRWGHAKLRRTGSVYVRVGQENLKCQTGIFVDIFPMDDVPVSTIGQMFQDFYCFCLRKILWSEVAKYNEKGFWKVWFGILSKIPVKTVFRWLSVYTGKSSNSSPNMVRSLLFTAVGKLYRKASLQMRYGVPKEWFLERAEYDFEGHKLYGSKDYDAVLCHMYGNYMELPPEKQRIPHSPFTEIVFPD